jgi:hypothetical protein
MGEYKIDYMSVKSYTILSSLVRSMTTPSIDPNECCTASSIEPVRLIIAGELMADAVLQVEGGVGVMMIGSCTGSGQLSLQA